MCRNAPPTQPFFFSISACRNIFSPWNHSWCISPCKNRHCSVELHLVCPRLSAESFKGTCSCALSPFPASAINFASAIDLRWRSTKKPGMGNHEYGKKCSRQLFSCRLSRQVMDKECIPPSFFRVCPRGRIGKSC